MEEDSPFKNKLSAAWLWEEQKKKTYVKINSKEGGYEELISNACILAEAEGLTAHSMSLKERLEAKNIKA